MGWRRCCALVYGEHVGVQVGLGGCAGRGAVARIVVGDDIDANLERELHEEEVPAKVAAQRWPRDFGVCGGGRPLEVGVGALAYISPMSIALPWDQRSVCCAPGTVKWKSATRCFRRVSTYVADASTFARGIIESIAACMVARKAVLSRGRWK